MARPLKPVLATPVADFTQPIPQPLFDVLMAITNPDGILNDISTPYDLAMVLKKEQASYEASGYEKKERTKALHFLREIRDALETAQSLKKQLNIEKTHKLENLRVFLDRLIDLTGKGKPIFDLIGYNGLFSSDLPQKLKTLLLQCLLPDDAKQSDTDTPSNSIVARIAALNEIDPFHPAKYCPSECHRLLAKIKELDALPKQPAIRESEIARIVVREVANAVMRFYGHSLKRDIVPHSEQPHLIKTAKAILSSVGIIKGYRALMGWQW